jgi:HemY protein
MMRAVLYLVLVGIAIAVSVWFANNPGDVTILWRGWRVDTSVGILLAFMVAIVFVLFGIGKVIGMVRGSINIFAATRRNRRLKQGFAALGHGFAAVAAEQPAQARKFAKEAATLLDDNIATRVLAAQTAALNNDGQGLRAESIHLLDKTETELAALRALTSRALSDGDFAGAQNYAKRAMARKDAPKWALEMLLDAHIAAARWSDALAAIDTKLARDHFGADGQRRIKSECLTRLAEDALGHGDAAAAEQHGRNAIEAGGDERAVIAFSRALMLQTKTKKAMAQIEKIWSAAPSDALYRAYTAALSGESALEQARHVERLAASNADHPESRLAVARASVKAQLWGQARNRLAPLLGEEVNRTLQARAATLMAEIETAEHQDAAAGAKWLRKALELSQSSGSGAIAPRGVADLLATKAE